MKHATIAMLLCLNMGCNDTLLDKHHSQPKLDKHNSQPDNTTLIEKEPPTETVVNQLKTITALDCNHPIEIAMHTLDFGFSQGSIVAIAQPNEQCQLNNRLYELIELSRQNKVEQQDLYRMYQSLFMAVKDDKESPGKKLNLSQSDGEHWHYNFNWPEAQQQPAGLLRIENKNSRHFIKLEDKESQKTYRYPYNVPWHLAINELRGLMFESIKYRLTFDNATTSKHSYPIKRFVLVPQENTNYFSPKDFMQTLQNHWHSLDEEKINNEDAIDEDAARIAESLSRALSGTCDQQCFHEIDLTIRFTNNLKIRFSYNRDDNDSLSIKYTNFERGINGRDYQF